MIFKIIRKSHCLLTARWRLTGRGLLATMLKVEVGKGRFYVSRHDAKPSSGAEHDARSAAAGMVSRGAISFNHTNRLFE